ncbi:MAG: hypothetical protein HC890_03760 [Chloroflexaceae bacterium]|nr:hypothetical protein [Chloroflexaceae bacterium]
MLKIFWEFNDLHLTFHLGDDKIWRQQDYSDYTSHNLAQINQIFDVCRSQGKLVKHPLINEVLKHQDIKYWFFGYRYSKTWRGQLKAKLRGILQELADRL